MGPATAKEWTRVSFRLDCGVTLCGDQLLDTKSGAEPKAQLLENLQILA